jgi:transglutaminase-like putative cysteine protease
MNMVNVELGKLACSGLEGHFGTCISAGTRKALLHYAYKLKVGRRPVAAPRFLRAEASPEVKFDLTLDRETEALLAQEARRQQTTTSRLAAHAVLVYLAELDFLGVVPRGTTPPTDSERNF